MVCRWHPAPTDRTGQVGGVAVAGDVGPPDRRRLLEQVLVQRGLLQAAGLHGVGHRGQLVFGDHQISHQHGLPVGGAGERDPRPE